MSGFVLKGCCCVKTYWLSEPWKNVWIALVHSTGVDCRHLAIYACDYTNQNIRILEFTSFDTKLITILKKSKKKLPSIEIHTRITLLLLSYPMKSTVKKTVQKPKGATKTKRLRVKDTGPKPVDDFITTDKQRKLADLLVLRAKEYCKVLFLSMYVCLLSNLYV